MKKVLIVAQAIPQWYVDLLTEAMGEKANVEIITGSKVEGNVILSPPYDAASFKTRLVCWWRHLRFMQKWLKKNRGKHYDLIFAVSNPPINSYIGLRLKKAFHAPFIYMNWDLYPQYIEYMIRNTAVKGVCKLWHLWNSGNYPGIDRMLTIGEVVAESMNRDLKKKIPVSVIPIAADTDKLKPIPKAENPFCVEHDLTDKFVVMYSGKMGYGHNIEIILRAAQRLREQEQIRFVFIGDGPKYAIAEEFRRKHDLRNILLLPLQPEETFPMSMASGDIGIVSQEARMAHLFMPSKAYSMMACGMGIIGICSNDDDLKRMITKHRVGVCIQGDDERVLAEKIMELYRDSDMLAEYKKQAVKTAETRYSKKVITEKYKKVFKKYLDV